MDSQAENTPSQALEGLPGAPGGPSEDAIPDFSGLQLPPPPEKVIFAPSERIVCREQFGLLLNDLELTGRAIEIGTYVGDFAIDLLANWKGKLLHVIDPWNTYEGYPSDKDYMTDLPHKKQVFRERLAPFAHRIAIHHGYSQHELLKFPHNYFDFGYIDGNHTYPYVRQDLGLLWPRIRPGGIIAGHDFEAGGPWANDTRQAVLDFFGELGLSGYWCSGDAHSWYVYKPREPHKDFHHG